MVIGLLTLTAIPAVTGISQAISAQKNQEQRLKDEKRMRKFNIDIEPVGTNSKGNTIDHGRVVVKNQRVWIGPPSVVQEGQYGYVAECIIVEYPDTERTPVALGLASQVSDNPPLLNWIYVDKDTMELKYGNKTTSITHHVGSWDWTEDEQYLTLEEAFVANTQGQDFVAVENLDAGRWQLFYDLDGDGLQNYVPDKWAKTRVRMRRTLVI